MLPRDFRLQEDQFVRWLKAHSDDLVGYRGAPCDCPVARWLKSMGATLVTVNKIAVRFDGTCRRSAVWVRRAVELVDNCVPDRDDQQLRGYAVIALLAPFLRASP
jgi:hypothetical protein